ncbi:hypothetical protein D3C73_706320 [compost metagenome]
MPATGQLHGAGYCRRRCSIQPADGNLKLHLLQACAQRGSLLFKLQLLQREHVSGLRFSMGHLQQGTAVRGVLQYSCRKLQGIAGEVDCHLRGDTERFFQNSRLYCAIRRFKYRHCR